jgi:hypothetical protein
MAEFKPMVRMASSEPSAILKLKKGGKVAKDGNAEAGYKKMAGGGAMEMLATTPAFVGRPAVNAPVKSPGKPSMAKRKKAMEAKKMAPKKPAMAAKKPPMPMPEPKGMPMMPPMKKGGKVPKMGLGGSLKQAAAQMAASKPASAPAPSGGGFLGKAAAQAQSMPKQPAPPSPVSGGFLGKMATQVRSTPAAPMNQAPSSDGVKARAMQQAQAMALKSPAPSVGEKQAQMAAAERAAESKPKLATPAPRRGGFLGKMGLMGRKEGGPAKKEMESKSEQRKEEKMDKAQDKAMVKKAFKQHDMQEHKGGKGTKLT